MPTPTRGSALITFFTVAWSENANSIEAVDKKALGRKLQGRIDSGDARQLSAVGEREFLCVCEVCLLDFRISNVYIYEQTDENYSLMKTLRRR